MNSAAEAQQIAQLLAKEWGLTLETPFPLSTCSFVVACEGDLVLKVPYEESEERQSAWVLLAYADLGGVEVLRFDESTGAILMPRLGIALSDSVLLEEERVSVCAGLIKRLHEAPLDDRGIALEKWFSEPPADAPELMHAAWSVAKTLMETTSHRVILHGDLHHFNILQGTDGWRAIDPKGLVGDPAYEPCSYLRNPVGGLPPDDELAGFMARRLELFASFLPYPAERMWGWAFAQTVWCGQDCSWSAGADWQRAGEALWEIKRSFWP